MERYVRRGVEQPQPLGSLSREMSQLLRNRGISTPEEAQAFLHPDWSYMHDPMSMQDMDQALDLIHEAREQDWLVQVYGDYDVDGVCATTILMQTFRRMGLRCAYRIPSRHSEGYGLNLNAVEEIAKSAQLLITVDCGITSVAEVRRARELGLKVIVSDHHALPEELPQADAVLNPLLGTYACRRLCGAGVALKIVQGLMHTPWAGPLLGPDWDLEVCDVAALATVVDIVPLAGENRIIVHRGMQEMGKLRRPGLSALMEAAGVKPPVTSTHLAFQLGPRINAGGRLENADQCVELLLGTDPEESRKAAQHLEENNRRRQQVESEVVAQALKKLKDCTDFYQDVCLVVEGEGWENGVIGLAAGRLCERYHMPSIVLSVQGETAVGSCRSVEGVNIHRMLTACSELLVRFGGHELAAGLTIETGKIPEFRRRLNAVIRETCDLQCLIPEKEYDLPLDLTGVTMEFARELACLEPFGNGNPAPLFYLHDAQVQMMRAVGRQQAHLQLEVAQGREIRRGIAFGKGSLASTGMDRVDVLFSPEINEYAGRVSVQLMVQALRPNAMSFPQGNGVFMGFLQEIRDCASKQNSLIPHPARIRLAEVERMREYGRGVLLIAHEPGQARQVLSRGSWDIYAGAAANELPFNTMLVHPRIGELQDVWEHIVFLDGDVIPGEAAWIREMCPRAELHALDAGPAMTGLLASLNMQPEALRELYRDFCVHERQVEHLPVMGGFTAEQQLLAIAVFEELELLKVERDGRCRILPPHKVDLMDSALLRAVRSAGAEIPQA